MAAEVIFFVSLSRTMMKAFLGIFLRDGVAIVDDRMTTTNNVQKSRPADRDAWLGVYATCFRWDRRGRVQLIKIREPL
jgi:hypothetical protein